VLARLNPEELQRCFLRRREAVSEVTQGAVVALDGKTLRRSFERATGRGAIPMVSAWASANRVVLGQQKGDEESNEITALPALLRLLALKGCIITIAAMGCQTAIARTIVEQEADSVFALKADQGFLYGEVQRSFAGRNSASSLTSPISTLTLWMGNMVGSKDAATGWGPTSAGWWSRKPGRAYEGWGW
jgi:hypothetical protein